MSTMNYGPQDENALRGDIVTNPDSAILRYNLATILLAKRDFDGAERELTEAIKLDTEIAECYVQLGGIAMHRGNLDLCFAYNEKAASIRSRFAVPHGNMGFVMMQKQEPKKAQKHLKQAISLDPKFIQAITTLASSYLMTKDFQGCIEQCEKALMIEPKFGPAYNNMGIAYLELGKKKEAYESFTKALEAGFEVDKTLLKEATL